MSGAKLDSWIVNSLPKSLIRSLHHVALRGRQKPDELSWVDRMMPIMRGPMNRDRQAAREEMQGFDYMDKASIQPIVHLIRDQQAATGPPTHGRIPAFAPKKRLLN